MNTVFIAERGYDYEGFEIIGVFNTLEEAEECVKKDSGGDFHDIEKFVVGEKK